MKKFLNSFTFVIKAALLVVLLIFGWAFINVNNLVKGKKFSKDASSGPLWGPNSANADVPASTTSTTSTGSTTSTSGCPHVAYFDGKGFRTENDFLCGSPAYFAVDTARNPEIKHMPVRADMVKFNGVPQKKDGALVLQLQENEPEESFVDWLKLIRVVHPKNSEVVVDSGFKYFHVFDRSAAERNVNLPGEVLLNGVNVASNFKKRERLWADPKAEEEQIFKKNDRVEFAFGGLKADAAPALLIKSTFRDWMMGGGNVEDARKSLASYLPASILRAAPAVLVVLAYFIFERRSATGLFAFVPFLVGSGAQSKSIVFSYKDRNGNFVVATVNKPRAWRYGTEYVALPAEAVQEDGSMRLRADFTKRHKLAFVGVLQGQKEEGYREEELSVVRAQSSRQGDVTERISKDTRDYAHMIPGDKIDVEFESPKLRLADGEKETYVMQSSGFYTGLSRKSAEEAGNWQEGISPEAQEHFASLTNLKDYL